MDSPGDIDDDFFSLPTSTTDIIDGFINSIPVTTEAVYYASEYLRLQNEIDSWKEIASKYKIENENLKNELEKQTELVNTLTKEKSQQRDDFQLGRDQLKRDNVILVTSMKKYGAANKLYIEKYRRLKLEHENLKRENSFLKSSTKENEKKLQYKNYVYSKALDLQSKFLNKCNNQLELCAKKLNGETVEISSAIPLMSKNLKEVNIHLDKNIKIILAKVGLNTNQNGNNLLVNSNVVQYPGCQGENGDQGFRIRITNNLLVSSEENQAQATVPMAPITATYHLSTTSHQTSNYNILQRSWNGGQVFQKNV